ncbi:hypothetical protein [Streptomyces sp. BK239]|nr:hypothetical protein [Streptomyces sp. BK239]
MTGADSAGDDVARLADDEVADPQLGAGDAFLGGADDPPVSRPG